MSQLSQHRKKMENLEAAIITLDMPGPDLEVEHYFAHGTYTRVLHIPAGTIITGKIHRYSCVNIVSQGKIAVITDEGEFEIEAPHIFVSGPGVKKAGVALEDTIWINVHPWEGEEDLKMIEQTLIAPNYEALECLG